MLLKSLFSVIVLSLAAVEAGKKSKKNKESSLDIEAHRPDISKVRAVGMLRAEKAKKAKALKASQTENPEVPAVEVPKPVEETPEKSAAISPDYPILKDGHPIVNKYIKSDVKAEELTKLEPAKLTAEELNNVKDHRVCAVLTAETLKAFDATNLQRTCYHQIPQKEWEKMEAKTALELMKSDAQNLDYDLREFKTLLKRAGVAPKDLPATFTAFAVRRDDLLAHVIGTKDKELINAFLTPKNVPAISTKMFMQFGPTFVPILSDKVFEGVRSEQFGALPAETVSALRAEQCASLKADALTGLTLAQAKALTPECMNKMTVEHMANFGRSPKTIGTLKSTAGTEARQMEVTDRMSFKVSHPCNAVSSGLKGKLTEPLGKALESRCAEVKSFQPNNGQALKNALWATGATLTVALVPMFL